MKVPPRWPRRELRDESTVGIDEETRQLRREDQDESAVRVDDESLEMCREMSHQRELATGARGSDARSCYDTAGKTPPIPLTGQSPKGGIGRVVPADHEAAGQ